MYVALNKEEKFNWFEPIREAGTRKQALVAAFNIKPNLNEYNTSKRNFLKFRLQYLGEYLIDFLFDQAVNLCGWDTWQGLNVTDSQYEDLNNILEVIMVFWLKKHSLDSNCYYLCEIQKHTWRDAALAAMEIELKE